MVWVSHRSCSSSTGVWPGSDGSYGVALMNAYAVGIEIVSGSRATPCWVGVVFHSSPPPKGVGERGCPSGFSGVGE